MAIYTFHLRKPNGSASHFEAHDLASDEAAEARAHALLQGHASASHVEAYDSRDGWVLTRARPSLAD